MINDTRPDIDDGPLGAYDQVTRNEALRALTAAAKYDDSENPTATPWVSGTVGDQVTSWALDAAHQIVSRAIVLAWDPGLHEADGHGLLVATGGGALYRFATDRPTELPAALRAMPTGRHLQVVREAS